MPYSALIKNILVQFQNEKGGKKHRSEEEKERKNSSEEGVSERIRTKKSKMKKKKKERVFKSMGLRLESSKNTSGEDSAAAEDSKAEILDESISQSSSFD